MAFSYNLILRYLNGLTHREKRSVGMRMIGIWEMIGLSDFVSNKKTGMIGGKILWCMMMVGRYHDETRNAAKMKIGGVWQMDDV